MASHQQEQTAIKAEIEKLINELESIYMEAFERLSIIEVKEIKIAKTAQLFLQSKEAAILPLNTTLRKFLSE